MTEAQISTLLEAIPLSAILIGQGERILGANLAAQEMFGKGIVGRHFITALRQPSMLDVIESCLRDHKTRKSKYLGNDGTRDTTFEVTCSFVDTSLGRGVLVCLQDTTQLAQAVQMRRDFVANVSHELRTPLTALLGFIETLQGPARNDDAARERFLGIMYDEASRMERLVHDLLSLNKVETQERVRPSQKVDIGEILSSVQHSIRPLADEAGVKIAYDRPDEALLIPGDRDQLTQVFTNLIENAVKYGGRDKTVFVSVEKSAHEAALRGAAIAVSVRDMGPGIDEQHLPRLTERFYRIDNHRSREMGGTGLGLAIVKHIVNRHRGRLRVRSQIGEGSVFKVLLPLDLH